MFQLWLMGVVLCNTRSCSNTRNDIKKSLSRDVIDFELCVYYTQNSHKLLLFYSVQQSVIYYWCRTHTSIFVTIQLFYTLHMSSLLSLSVQCTFHHSCSQIVSEPYHTTLLLYPGFGWQRWSKSNIA